MLEIGVFPAVNVSPQRSSKSPAIWNSATPAGPQCTIKCTGRKSGHGPEGVMVTGPLQCLDEGVNDSRIELPAGICPQLGDCFCEGHRGPVGPV